MKDLRPTVRAGLADRTTALVGWTIAWRATSAVATIALGAVLVRQLPTSEYGRYTLVLSVLVYIALLATFGQDQGLLRYLPEVLARGDRAAAQDLLRKSAIAVVAIWALTSLAVFLLRPLIDSALHAHVADLLALGTVLLLGGIAAGVLSFALVAIYDMRSQAIATPIAGAHHAGAGDFLPATGRPPGQRAGRGRGRPVEPGRVLLVHPAPTDPPCRGHSR